MSSNSSFGYRIVLPPPLLGTVHAQALEGRLKRIAEKKTIARLPGGRHSVLVRTRWAARRLLDRPVQARGQLHRARDQGAAAQGRMGAGQRADAFEAVTVRASRHGVRLEHDDPDAA